MKGLLLPCMILLSLLPVRGQRPPAPYGAVPSAAQQKWHELEIYSIIHFGMNTYTNKEWGYGDEDPAIVQPAQFDADQIVRAARAGGCKGIVVVAKHHDGFCLWPTATTTYNICKSPWKNGRGDMVAEYRRACDAAGVQLGLYCSPWDRNTALYGTSAYVQLYRQQLRELYTKYGPLFISWHDGANGGDGYYGGARTKRTIDRTGYYGWDSIWALVRSLQPGAAIFGDVGLDVRWVGNEEGIAGETCWATYTPQAPDEGRQPANGYSKYWEATTGTRNGDRWMPAECDVPLRPGWFYHQDQDGQVKSPAALADLYYKSVGRGACLDLGLAPGKDGRLHANDVAALKAFGEWQRQTFRVNLLKKASIRASNIRAGAAGTYGTACLTDADRYSYWATDDTVLHPVLTARWQQPQTFDVIRLRENIRLGQRITGVAIDIWRQEQWQQVATATSIGANRLIRLTEPVTTGRVRLRITGADACVALSDFGLFREAPLTAAVDNMTGAAFNNYDKKGWKLGPAIAAGNTTAQAAIDDQPATFFYTTDSVITVDMRQVQQVKGMTYLPRQDKATTGVITHYTCQVSTDAIHWKQVAAGEFSNIAANPVLQVVHLDKPLQARYIRLTALQVLSGKGIAVAELGVFGE